MPAESPDAFAGERTIGPPGPEAASRPGHPAKGSEVRIARCTAHGIAYDSEREVCPECAKGAPASNAAPSPASLHVEPSS
jgi:hypothetical protein